MCKIMKQFISHLNGKLVDKGAQNRCLAELPMELSIISLISFDCSQMFQGLYSTAEKFPHSLLPSHTGGTSSKGLR